VQIDTNADIFAIGDAHSDYARLASAMKAAGLIAGVPKKPEDVKWSAGSAVLVVTGDMIDKGPHAIDVLRLLHSLQVSALAKGGRVAVLAGNHEAEFLADPAAPKGEAFATQLKAGGIRPSEVAACKSDIGEFLCSLPFAARVNDWFFSHGGNSGGRSLVQLADDLQKGVMKDGFATKQLIGGGSVSGVTSQRKGRRAALDRRSLSGLHRKAATDQLHGGSRREAYRRGSRSLAGQVCGWDGEGTGRDVSKFSGCCF